MRYFPAALAALAGAASLSACAVPPDPANPAQMEQHRLEARTEQVRNATDDMPSWYMTPPADTATSLFAAGTATSGDLQLAFDKAVIAAKRTLADRVNSKLSSKLKEFLSEGGATDDARVIQESERVTNNLITEVNLSGYTVDERKLSPAGPQFRAYILLQYPLGSANRILVEQIQRNQLLESHARASTAFQELEHDITGARPATPPPATPASGGN